MTTFVLMHGGGMGGWVWADVAAALRADGHRVLTPTFTGFGERSHLISRDVTHDVHVTDVVNTLIYEDVEDAVLVGFSYGGSVLPGVVAQAGDRIRRAIYLDGIVPEAGEAVAQTLGYMTAEECAGLNALLASGEGPVGSGVDKMQRDMAAQKPFKMSLERQGWLLKHMSDMPMRGMVSPVTTGASSIKIPVDYLGVPNDVMAAVMHDRARALGWKFEAVSDEWDHAFIVGAPEVAIKFLKARA